MLLLPPFQRSSVLKLMVLSGLFVLAGTGTLIAQEVQPRPVARLISTLGSVENATSPRSRRIDTLSPNAKTSAKAVASPGLAEVNSIERRAFDATNAVRSRNGLAPLMWEPELCLLARRHSESMARMGYFGHETPEGMRLKDRARTAGIRGWRVLAENIAYNQGYNDPGAFAVERWMISPGHRANILDRTFQGVAIGSHVAANGRVYLTQIFITRLTP